ncbi:MAG TPA: hypothetical protein V6D07_09745 [Trichocoleus sp.]
MVAKLVTAAGDAVADPTLTAFLAVPSAEAQLVFVAERLQTAQKTYNSTEPAPDPLINRVAAIPQSAGIAIQAAIPLAPGALSQIIYNAVTAIGVGATKIAAAGGDVVTDATLTTFLGLASLEAQLVFLAARIQNAEQTYNTANPETPQNVITVSPNYDANQVGISALFPLAPAGLSSMVGALPY